MVAVSLKKKKKKIHKRDIKIKKEKNNKDNKNNKNKNNKNKVENTAHIYPAVNHGFHNNTTPRYDEAAATLSWQRTIDFFKDKLNKK